MEGGVEPSVLLLGATTRHNPSLNRVPAARSPLLGGYGNRRILWVSSDREPEIVSKVLSASERVGGNTSILYSLGILLWLLYLNITILI